MKPRLFYSMLCCEGGVFHFDDKYYYFLLLLLTALLLSFIRDDPIELITAAAVWCGCLAELDAVGVSNSGLTAWNELNGAPLALFALCRWAMGVEEE